MTGTTLLDPGLQPERTRLAWRRTVTALSLAALVSLRVLPPTLGTWALAASSAGVVASGALWVAAARRGTAVDRALGAPGTPLPDGALPCALAALVTTGAALAGLALLTGLRL